MGADATRYVLRSLPGRVAGPRTLVRKGAGTDGRPHRWCHVPLRGPVVGWGAVFHKGGDAVWYAVGGVRKGRVVDHPPW